MLEIFKEHDAYMLNMMLIFPTLCYIVDEIIQALECQILRSIYYYMFLYHFNSLYICTYACIIYVFHVSML